MGGDPGAALIDAGLCHPSVGVKLLGAKLLQLGGPHLPSLGASWTDSPPPSPCECNVLLLLAHSAEDTARLVWGAPWVTPGGAAAGLPVPGEIQEGPAHSPRAPADFAGGKGEKRGVFLCPDPYKSRIQRKGADVEAEKAQRGWGACSKPQAGCGSLHPPGTGADFSKILLLPAPGCPRRDTRLSRTRLRRGDNATCTLPCALPECGGTRSIAFAQRRILPPMEGGPRGSS